MVLYSEDDLILSDCLLKMVNKGFYLKINTAVLSSFRKKSSLLPVGLCAHLAHLRVYKITEYMACCQMAISTLFIQHMITKLNQEASGIICSLLVMP